MGVLRIFFLFTMMLSLGGCARLGYLFEQGLGQWDLLHDGEKNEDILKDPARSEKIKSKIRSIVTFKKWFYEYWNKEPSGIYSKTVFLNRDAVTWLVIASPFDRIEAKEHCFPFYGCFPYLGFFKKTSAQDFVKNLEEEDLQTYVRPVKAYSTLGKFDDAILSTFFEFDDIDLAEVVFHELFHTIFFVKNEVDLNESLANLVGKEMVKEYFSFSQEKVDKELERERQFDLINRKINKLSLELDISYEKAAGAGKLDKMKASAILENFLSSRFIPEIKKTCLELGMKEKKCWPLERSWNNASFAALGTYEEKKHHFEEILKTQGSLKKMFDHIRTKYEEYRKKGPDMSFETFLFGA